MHPLGWCLIVVLFLLSFVGWIGRPFPTPPVRKKKTLSDEVEKLERR